MKRVAAPSLTMTDPRTQNRLKLKNVHHPLLHIDSFTVQDGESWCIYGGRDSGIDQFLELIQGTFTPESAAVLERPEHSAVLSFTEQQRIYEEEIRKDDTDFMDKPDPGTPARDFLPERSLSHPLVDRFGMRELLNSGYRSLSSGQARKLLLLKALFSESRTIVLDSPYDGLDVNSCRELNQALAAIPKQNYCLMLFVRNISDIPSWSSHIALFHDHRLQQQGKREPLVKQLSVTTDTSLSQTLNGKDELENEIPAELIRLRNGSISYEGNRIFEHLDLTIHPGDHTLVTGPNGCGKSSLLQMITGDNPKCFLNDLNVYGKPRGSGESVWDIKRHMGIVSADLHRNYRVSCSCLHVVLSGYFDSIGLYDRVSTVQKHEAIRWLELVELEQYRDKPFRQLPYGEQRLLLIARALIKNPWLLILDEPTQGLDDRSRNALLDYLEKASSRSLTTIIYVSHREDEHRSFYRQHIQLEQYTPHTAGC